MNAFPHIFYTAAVLAVIAASLAACVPYEKHRYAALCALIGPLVLVYVLGMYRTAGADFLTYESYLRGEGDVLQDLGYRLLMDLTRAAGLNLSEFFLLQGLFSLVAVYALARRLRSDLVITFALYGLHAALVRDFTQSRIALALAIYFIALCQDRKIAYALLTVAAASVHLTLVPLVLVYHWARFLVGLGKRAQIIFFAGPAVVLLTGMTVVLPMLASVDPRIEVYMNWDQDLYGNPVGSYSTVLLFLLLAAICYRAYQLTGDKESKVLMFMMVYAGVTFIAFSHLAIFAFRLANVVAALYPFAVGRAIFLLKDHEPKRLHHVAVPLALLGALLLAVVARPGSLDVLRETQPALIQQ